MRCCRLLICLFAADCSSQLAAESPLAVRLPRCEVVPLPEMQFAVLRDQQEQWRWHFGQHYRRPFLYPLRGPSRVPLTRMGHPGAPNHDHHQSVWFAHHDVDGESFWTHAATTRIRQKQWLAYHADDDHAALAVQLAWLNAAGSEVLEQRVIFRWEPLADGASWLEIQTDLTPAPQREHVTLGKTNFGLLAVRVAGSISAHFGGGMIRNSEGEVNEDQVFEKTARWVDYSGPVAVWENGEQTVRTEGITYFEHALNPGYPNPWHVRSDGWMTSSITMRAARQITNAEPLRLRYLLHVHGGDYQPDVAAKIADKLNARGAWTVVRSAEPHQHWEIRPEKKKGHGEALPASP